MSKDSKKLRIEKRIDQYVNGELSQQEIDDLWAEMIQQEEYIEYLKTSANLKDMIADEQPSSGKKRGFLFAAAAAVVLLLAVAGVFKFNYFNNTPRFKPVKTLDLGYKRSPETNSASKHKKIIRHALDLYKEQKFDKAVGFLKSNLDKATNVDWIAMLDITIGTLYYNNDQFNKATYYFKDVVQRREKVKQVKLDKAYWYLGNAYFQLGMNKKATTAMEKAYEINGAYSRVAKSYLDAMAQARNQD